MVRMLVFNVLMLLYIINVDVIIEEIPLCVVRDQTEHHHAGVSCFIEQVGVIGRWWAQLIKPPLNAPFNTRTGTNNDICI